MTPRPTLHLILVSRISAYISTKHRVLNIIRNNTFSKSKELEISNDAGLDRAVKYMKFIIEGNFSERELFEIVKEHASRKQYGYTASSPLGSSVKLRTALLHGLMDFLSQALVIDRSKLNKLIKQRKDHVVVMPSAWGGAATVPPSELEVISDVISDLCANAEKQNRLNGFFTPTGAAQRAANIPVMFGNEKSEEQYLQRSEKKGIEPVTFKL